MSDIRFAVRLLLKNKGFTFVAAGVLALGISAVATQFSIVSALLLRGLPFPEPEQLYFLQRNLPDNAPGDRGVSPLDLEDWRAVQTTFEDLAGNLNGSTVNVTIGDEAKRYTGAYVTPNYFKVLRARLAMGREFTDAENQPGAARVTVISHGVWQRDFSGRADVLGQTFRMNGRTATVIGVMTADFARFNQEEFWIPLYNEFDPRAKPRGQGFSLGIIGRLKKGMSLDQAQIEMNALAGRLAKEYPESNKDFTEVQIRTLQAFFFGPQFAGLMYVMLGCVATVLLIACVNVMNMQFARIVLRSKELAVRAALGAGPWRVMRQMLGEGTLLAALGALLGVAMSYWFIAALWRWNEGLTNPLPSWMRFSLDGRVVVAVVICAILAALVSTLLPAWLAVRANLHDALKDTGRGNSSGMASRLSRIFVIAQIAMTCALLIATLFMVRSIRNQSTLDLGFDPNRILTARMGLFDGDFPKPEDRVNFYERVARELRAGGKFSEVALTDRFRMMFSSYDPVRLDGKAYDREKDIPSAFRAAVSPGFFKALDLQLRAGRDFADDDKETKLPVAIVNATFVKKYFTDKDPLGQRFRDGPEAENRPWRTIVGVAPDTLMQGPFDNQHDSAGYFVPLDANPANFMTVIVRSREPGRDPLSLAPLLRAELRKLDANLPLYFLSTPAGTLDELLAPTKLIASLFAAFGIVAVVLAAAGLYGVMAFSVNQRTGEFGIRVALGAASANIMGLIYRQGSLQVIIGLALGLIAAVGVLTAFGTGIRNFLFQVRLADPLIYVSVATLLALVAAIACLFPALRASRVDPIEALRME